VAPLPTEAPLPPAATLLVDLERAVQLMRGVLRGAVPGALSGGAAHRFVTLFSEAERAAASGVALFAPVVVETGEYTKGGHGSAADWLGALSGSSSGAAKGRLAAAERASRDPLLTEALHDAELSADQLKLVATTTAEVPEAAGNLLELVEQGASHQELSTAAARMRAASRSRESERLRRARVHANRHFRYHQDENGGIRGEFFCDEVAWARVAPLIETDAKRRWKTAGDGHGGRDSFEAHRLDALLDLLAGSRGPGQGARPRTLIVVNAESLRRGTTEGDELCEIEGIGPVSVPAATELLSEGGFQFLVKDGFDIRTATRSTRVVTNCVDMALMVRDRVCAVPGCGKRVGLERDHRRVDYGNNGRTELDNLVRLCPAHHALKTDGGWRLEGQPGAWKWVAPPKPPSAQQIARARKVTVAKGKAFVAKDRNSPRRT
jgi:hypothetical protein